MIPFYKGDLGNFVNESLKDVMSSGIATNYGKYYNELKDKLDKYLNPYKTTLVASGTHALTLSLLALRNTGVIPKKARILVPSFTFIATVQAILLAGMKPVFGDIFRGDWTLDMHTATGEFDAVMPVNIFGVQPEIWEEYPSVPDLSHAFGGSSNNIRNGTQGTICAFSTSITKPFHTVEGGIVSSSHEHLIEEVSSMSKWCLTKDYDCTGAGQWSKMSELHALVGLESFKRFEDSIAYKEILAERYKQGLDGLPVERQYILPTWKSTRKDFAILVPANKRAAVLQKLDENEIGYKLYFSPAVHETTYFKKLFPRQHLPVTEEISSRIICLPIHQNVRLKDVDFICDVIRKSLLNV